MKLGSFLFPWFLSSHMYDFWLGSDRLSISTPNLYKKVIEKERDSSRILDVGMGTCVYFENPEIIEKIHTKNISIKGIDINKEHLAFCRKRIERNRVEKVEVLYMDLFDYSDEKYDTIFFMESAPLIPQETIVQMMDHIETSLLLQDNTSSKIVFVNNLNERATPFQKWCKKNIHYLVPFFPDHGNTLNKQFFLTISERCNQNYTVDFELLASATLETAVAEILYDYPLILSLVQSIFQWLPFYKEPIEQYKITFNI
jgi:protein-L-isoaspartate O-methyltransferase